MSKDRLYIVDGDQRIPFLRGMVTHALIERGLTFGEAYQTASRVRERLREKGEVSRAELNRLILGLVKKNFGHVYVESPEIFSVRSPTILVRGQESEVPFSKGILSQSLQASGLDPSVAYQVAIETEAALLGRDQKKISRDALRKLIYQNLVENHEARYGERYLLWRYFKSPDKPLIIMIGGATGVGKSSIATEVGHRLGIQRLISTDTIRQMMRMMFSADLMPVIHHSSYEAWKAELQKVPAANNVVRAFKEQALRVLVGLRAMLDRATQEETSLLIEGVHIVPGLLNTEAFEDQVNLVPIVISTLDEAGYLDRFPKRQADAKHRVSHRYRDHFEQILQIQDFVIEMSELHSVPVLENDNFDATVAAVLNVVSGTLQQNLGITREELVARAL